MLGIRPRQTLHRLGNGDERCRRSADGFRREM